MRTAHQALAATGIVPELLYLGDLRSPESVLKASRSLRVESVKFDIVHAQYCSALGWMTGAFATQSRTVLSIRGSDWTPWARHGLGAVHGRLGAALTRRSISRFDLLLPVSYRMAHEVRARSPHSRIKVLTDPIDLDRFSPEHQPEASRVQFGLEPDSPVVLFISASEGNSVKRPELARAAVEHARIKIPGLQVLVATGLAHEAMPRAIACADVVICTSRSEGWPNAIKEALACDVPFVATDVSDLRAIADAAPLCRVTAPDPVALGDALCDVIESPASQRRGLHLLMRGFSLTTFADQLQRSYLALLEHN